jgi:Rod binding domain-containing protein
MSDLSGVSPIDNSVLPADVRNGSQSDKDDYKAALQFERQLVEQLTQTMADTTKSVSGGGVDGSDGSDAATDSYKQMLPGVMADAVMGAGGLGLARSIAQNLKGQTS